MALSNRTGSTAHPYHSNLRIHTGVQLHLAGPISICNRTIWLGTQQASSLSSPAAILPCQLALLLDTALPDLSEKSSGKRNEASWNRAATSCLHYNADGPRACQQNGRKFFISAIAELFANGRPPSYNFASSTQIFLHRLRGSDPRLFETRPNLESYHIHKYVKQLN